MKVSGRITLRDRSYAEFDMQPEMKEPFVKIVDKGEESRKRLEKMAEAIWNGLKHPQ